MPIYEWFACWYCMFLSKASLQLRNSPAGFLMPANDQRYDSRSQREVATMQAWTSGIVGEVTKELPAG